MKPVLLVLLELGEFLICLILLICFFLVLGLIIQVSYEDDKIKYLQNEPSQTGGQQTKDKEHNNSYKD
jgi:hypothetical protein